MDIYGDDICVYTHVCGQQARAVGTAMDRVTGDRYRSGGDRYMDIYGDDTWRTKAVGTAQAIVTIIAITSRRHRYRRGKRRETPYVDNR